MGGVSGPFHVAEPVPSTELNTHVRSAGSHQMPALPLSMVGVYVFEIVSPTWMPQEKTC